MEYILFLISLPFFYFIGIIATVQYLLSRKSKKIPSDRTDVVRLVLGELTKMHETNPGASVHDVIVRYQQELAQSDASEPQSTPASSGDTNVIVPAHTPEASASTKPSVSFSRWYEENSVNLLLYVGAFLIVATASILVGFQWQSIGGGIKAAALTGAVLFFTASGVGLYFQKQVRTAGATFAAIGTLLIPFAGVGCYMFVLRDQGITLANVWIITSLIEIAVSLVLSTIIRQGLYGYIASFGSLSFILALLNSVGFRDQYYILGAQVTSFVLLAITRVFPSGDESVYRTPLRRSADIIAPLSLFYGAYYAIIHLSLFSVESAIAVCSGALYYLFSYLMERREYQLALAESIAFLSAVILLNSYQLPPQDRALYLSAYPICMALVAYISYRLRRVSESHISGIIAIFLSIYLYVMFVGKISDAFILSYLALLPGIVSLLLYLTSEKALYLLGFTASLAVATHHVFDGWFPRLQAEIQSVAYSAQGVLSYYMFTFQRKDSPARVYHLTASIILFVLSFIVAGEFTPYPIIITAFLTLITVDASVRFTKPALLIGSYLALYSTIWNALSYLRIPGIYFPYFFAIVSASLYLLSVYLRSPRQYPNRMLSSIGMITGTFGSVAYYPVIPHEQYPASIFASVEPVIAAYGAVAMFLVDTVLRQTRRSRYFLSLVTVAAISMHLRQLGITDHILYSVLWGTYFSSLGYFYHREKKETMAYLVDALGLFTLVVPPLFTSFGTDGARAAIVMGICGIGLFIYGISSGLKRFIYSGMVAVTLAVLSQTYRYIFGMEKWMVTGLLGVAFLTVAVYILFRRKNQP